MELLKNQITEHDDSFVFEKTKRLTIELPPPIEEILEPTCGGPVENSNLDADKTYWDRCIKETFEFNGMTPDWRFKPNFQKELIMYRMKPREADNLDINLVLNYLLMYQKNILYENMLKDENLTSIKSREDFRIWANKNPEATKELLLGVLPIAGDNVWNLENAKHAKRNLKYVGLLNENFRELWRKWIKREDEVCVLQEEVCALQEEISCKDAEIDRLKKAFKLAIEERDGHYEATQLWKQRVNELSEKFSKYTQTSVNMTNQKSSKQTPEDVRQIETLCSINNSPSSSRKQPGSNFLQLLKNRCDNMIFSHHIKSLQPPEKFDGCHGLGYKGLEQLYTQW